MEDKTMLQRLIELDNELRNCDYYDMYSTDAENILKELIKEYTER